MEDNNRKGEELKAHKVFDLVPLQKTKTANGLSMTLATAEWRMSVKILPRNRLQTVSSVKLSLPEWQCDFVPKIGLCLGASIGVSFLGVALKSRVHPSTSLLWPSKTKFQEKTSLVAIHIEEETHLVKVMCKNILTDESQEILQR